MGRVSCACEPPVSVSLPNFAQFYVIVVNSIVEDVEAEFFAFSDRYTRNRNLIYQL
ncbi:MAG: hypothetical protein KME21_30275 [Desmonostoc vinosum HA7617-LM4]|nr:hypothetical protein [Desmonostoc vinosum HA7617-LM4]